MSPRIIAALVIMIAVGLMLIVVGVAKCTVDEMNSSRPIPGVSGVSYPPVHPEVPK